ncbi:MAG: hypothetical protein LZF61_07820 [Nitrosomonas sp.]|nr:MAG: hypothetical protein LZF61_07820 [Nitrosomonas sp.]
MEFAHTFVGDLAPSDPPGSDEFGNLLTGPGAAPDREDTLRGSSGSDVAINIFNHILLIFILNSYSIFSH